MDEDIAGTVVVAVPDEPAQSALDYAAAEVTRRGGRVHVVHVVPALESFGVPAPMVVEGEVLRRAGAEALDRATAELEHRLPDHIVVPVLLHGPTVPTLLRASRGAKSVVLQRRHRDWRRTVTMSTSTGVAAHARTRVVVVPTDWAPDPEREAVVVVGVADVLTSPHLLASALEEAASRRGRLRVVHAWYFNLYDDLVFAGEVGKAQQAELEGRFTEDLAPTLALYPDVQVDVVVHHAHPADALTVEADRAGVLFIGRHRPMVRWGPHLGSVVRAVLREAGCPVVVVDEVASPDLSDAPSVTTP